MRLAVCRGIRAGSADAACPARRSRRRVAACLALAAAPLLCAMPALAERQETTYIIPIRGAIERALVYVLRRGVAQAETDKANAIVLVMDTPGGRIDSTEEIVQLLGAVSVPTYTFVEKDAFSAGAIIAMATDHIYMAPASRIGAATPFAATPLGGVQEVPEAIEEKHLSAVRAIIRSAAQQNGHDAELAEAMVDRKREYKIGEKVISRAGDLLTLTNVEAEEMVGEGDQRRPLLSRGTVKDIEELFLKIGRAGTRRVEMRTAAAEEIARFIEHPLVSVLLLLAGGLGLYIEFKTPGFGLPGIAGISALVVFFWGYHVAGLAGMEELVVFTVGVALLLLEIFVIPGFGIAGVAGILLMLGSLLFAMVQHHPGAPALAISWQGLRVPAIVLSSAIVGAGVAAVLLGRFLPSSPLFRHLVLEAAAGGDTAPGRRATDLLGARGIAQSDLRPAGTALFGEQRLDVVSQGDYIARGTAVRVVDAAGNRIVVERANGA